MALQLFEGFENSPEDRFSLSGGAATSAGTSRDGSDALSLTDANHVAVFDLPTPISDGTEIIVGFALYIDAGPGTTRSFFEIQNDDGGRMCELNYNPGTLILALDTSFGGGVSSGSLALDTWAYIEVVYTADTDGSNGSVELFIDGVSQGAETGVDTTVNAGPAESIKFKPDDSGYDLRIDDLYVLDGTGTALNSRLGDVTVEHLVPNGTGNYAQGTGSDGNSVDNYLLVDEQPADSADYVDMAVSDRESYTVPNLGAGEVPLAVRASLWAGENGDPDVAMDNFIRLSATDYDGSESHPVVQAYRWRDHYWEENPNTATTWAEDDLDGVEVGVRRVT